MIRRACIATDMLRAVSSLLYEIFKKLFGVWITQVTTCFKNLHKFNSNFTKKFEAM